MIDPPSKTPWMTVWKQSYDIHTTTFYYSWTKHYILYIHSLKRCLGATFNTNLSFFKHQTNIPCEVTSFEAILNQHLCRVEGAGAKKHFLASREGAPFPIGSMGLVYLPTWMDDFYGKSVGKYTSPMDPMGLWNYAEMTVPEESLGMSGFFSVKLPFVVRPFSGCHDRKVWCFIFGRGQNCYQNTTNHGISNWWGLEIPGPAIQILSPLYTRVQWFLGRVLTTSPGGDR